MRKYQLQILAWVFSAFIDNEDESDKPEDDYYALLGIRKNATADEIRRAYKKKSLQLHPDKIAQRCAAGDKTPEEIRRDFQKVKEAYECLSDPQQREIYDGLGSLGTKFINNPQAAMDPHTLLENLAKSSFCDRTKLFTVVLLLTLLVLMQPILICAKIDQDLKGVGILADSSWAAILTPLWFLDAVFLFLFTSAKVVGITIKFLCIIALQIFLALRWDETVSWSYAIVLIPLYLLEAARIGSCFYWIRKMNNEMLRMVTIEYLEEVIIPKHYSGKKKAGDGEEEEEKDEELGDEITDIRLYADLTEKERDEINHIYRIVHLPPDVTQAVDAGIEMDHDEQIAQSSEYQAAIEMQWQAVRAIRNIILIHLPTIVLLVFKADYIKDYSWWIVSVPLWAQIGLTMGKSCFTCCTAGAEVSSEDEEMLAAAMMAQAAGNKKNDKEDDGEKAEDQSDEPLAPPGNASSSDAGEKGTGDNVGEMAGSAIANKDVADEEKFCEEETKSSQDIDIEDLKSMKVSQLKAELEAYGVSTSSFIEKSEYVSALAEAKASGRPKTKVAQTTTTPALAKKQESKEADDDSDTSSGVYIDEETFRAWAAAQEAHEVKASEIAAKACARCCEQVFYAVMLALFVGKLAGEDVGGDPVGINSYSSFWILFPFLLVAGIFLCCCCCSIYCASGMEGMEENLRQSMSTKKPGDAGGGEDASSPAEAGPMRTDEEASPAPFIPVPPSPPPAEETKEEEQKTKVAEKMLAEAVKASKEQDVEPQSDSDGLD